MLQAAPPDVVFRFCRDADAPAVLALWQDAGATVTPTDTIEDIVLAIRHPAAVFLLATAGSQVVASLIGTFDGVRGEMYRLAVHPAYRRQNVARRLVSEVEAQLAERGAKRVTALVEGDHPWATGFWEAAGYRVYPGMLRYFRDLNEGKR